MRAVVIGGSGQIGGWLLRVLAARGHPAVGTYATVAFLGLVPLDAADLVASADWLRSQRPDVVFYPAGFTWVDGCERDPARARSANLDQPLNLARAAADLGAHFVYFSTDYVFDGAATSPYTDITDTVVQRLCNTDGSPPTVGSTAYVDEQGRCAGGHYGGGHASATRTRAGRTIRGGSAASRQGAMSRR